MIPEFTCDVGTKKGEKVDYAICNDGNVSILVECKPASSELSLNHASQLFRYFSVTEARVAILTNGVVFKFFSDIDTPNKMDAKPFFTLQMDALKKADIRTLSNFTKGNFDIETIVTEAGNLKMQSLVAKELEKEFSDPSDEFTRLIAKRIHEGHLTATIKESFKKLLTTSISSHIRDKVNERLTSALQASNPVDSENDSTAAKTDSDGVITTQDEIDGFNIVRAIGSRVISPDRIVMRDAKSYCAVLLDDNNRKTIIRLHFNSPTARYIGTFAGKEETRHSVSGPVDLYKFEKDIMDRITELEM
ncbi:type I restriction enzyme HsdR N-terminal domain-containing protein [Altericroceibacterium indicum]|uniref:type I restriction enzyme HsdR N-terminal domain-containing protein n=1 Tax=Altericroceibacterium indicum TaxID=374177 RepID=UPI0031B62232